MKMSNRITQKDLERQVDRINRLTKSPDTYSTVTDGKRVINIGHYHLDMAYGGNKLVRTVNNGGGIREISHMGYSTKKELFHWMNAFEAGLEVNGD